MAYDIYPFLVPTEYTRTDLELGQRSYRFLEDAGGATEVEHLRRESAFPVLVGLDNVLEQC